MTAKSGFAERLAYVRWLRSRGRVAPETDKELADALGVTYGWLTKWKVRPDAPEGRTETNAITKALQPMGVTADWLFDNKGDPPVPQLWAEWSQHLAGGPSMRKFGGKVVAGTGAKKPTAKKATGTEGKAG